MEGTAISWSETAFDSHNQLFPASVFPAETLDNLETEVSANNLTYTTLESVKLTSLEPMCSAGPGAADNVGMEQPMDLTLARQGDFVDMGDFRQPQVNKYTRILNLILNIYY